MLKLHELLTLQPARLRTFTSREEAALRLLHGPRELERGECSYYHHSVLNTGLSDHFWFLDIFIFLPSHGDGKVMCWLLFLHLL